MRIDIHHYHHTDTDPELTRRLDRIDQALQTIEQEVRTMALNLTGLEAEVAADTDAANAVATVIDRLIQAIEDQSGNQARIDAVLAQMKANKDTLIAAALRGTPAETPPAA